MKKIDCSQNCRMTKTLKDSEFCTGKARIEKGCLVFGCQDAMASEPIEVRHMYECNFWDLKIPEMCEVCELECVNNKNEKASQAREQREKISKILSELKPGVPDFGINAETIEKISQTYGNNESEEEMEYGIEAIEAAEFAQKVLTSAMNGAHIDIAYFKQYAQQTVNRINSLDKKHRQLKQKLAVQKKSDEN